ncbi:cation diffusion facilitator family transporter [Cytobacillus oceanisediminis]|uniref:cation diffusion facilitator family transporter n=1 Tax=Cytobacillus oceanisediminis TaxID=665099 RepID=UPI00254A8B3E|nr:cation diffusion facilitator family transporter [Cytobacillus oceanisediminis]MDK7669339.1 cation diffusion facilitator family transporter [Cytobacillus oceanisediminis]
MSAKNNKTQKNMGLAFFLNLGFTIIEIIGGFITGSIAIISDAVHDLGDSISIGVSWYLQKKSEKGADSHFTFGHKRLSLMGALLNAAVLLAGSIYVLYEAGKRLFNPVNPNSEGMLWLAILGIAVNGFAAYRLKKGDNGLNQKILSWHLIEDVLGWVAVLIVSIIMLFKDIPILDPLLSIGITFYILYHVIKNLKETLGILLDKVPKGIDTNILEEKIRDISSVEGLHHLHFWSIDGKEHAFSVHLEVPYNTETDSIVNIKKKIREHLNEFKVAHITIQFDYSGENCEQKE